MRHFLFVLLTCISLIANASNNFSRVEQMARGQTVYFNAWGGNPAVNDYLSWVTEQLFQRYGVKLKHVKVANIAQVVNRIALEKKSGRNRGGSVDALWVNGENFRQLKRQHLLGEPFAKSLPNWQYVDLKKSVLLDFAEPTDGLESPWGTAQLCFIADRKTVPNPPQSAIELLDFARKHPGKISYPRPPSFHGIAFLQQIMLELAKDKTVFSRPATDQSFKENSLPLWRYLDELHKYAWHKAKSFPPSAEKMQEMLSNGELLISLSFNPNDAAYLISKHRLSPSVYSYVPRVGSIANVHFIAIPFNANARAGALVLANFLLSPEAQSRKADIAFWGDPTVLDPNKIPMQFNKLFHQQSIGTLPANARTLLEPDSSWAKMLEREWIKRYGT